MPEALTHAFGGAFELAQQRVVVREEARDLLAECDLDRARERRDVDDRFRFLLGSEASASAETSRPSASVFSTSEVLPP